MELTLQERERTGDRVIQEREGPRRVSKTLPMLRPSREWVKERAKAGDLRVCQRLLLCQVSPRMGFE